MVHDDHLEIFQRIRSAYGDLSPSFRKIADFLLESYRDAAFPTRVAGGSTRRRQRVRSGAVC